MKNQISLIFLAAIAIMGCRPNDNVAEQTATSEKNAVQVAYDDAAGANKLGDYWYQGKAELNHYSLAQNRYKDVHPGEVVLIFVTEDFLTDKQVKNDHYTNPRSIPILKSNLVKQFPTGIYTYNIMTSVFTPANTKEHPMTLKVSNSSQEWCGQTYMQVNYDAKKRTYDYLLHSYFENEADKTGQVKGLLLEDELFNRIRIDPAALPLGKLELLPSTEYSRLTHRTYAPEAAEASMTNYTGGDFEGPQLKAYSVHFPNLNRTLEIVFENEPPFRIAGWKDTYPSMFDKQPRTTIAKRTHTIMDEYWSHNSLADMDKRSALGLE